MKPSESYLYLGVHVNLNLTWTKHMATLRTKMNEKTSVIRNMTHTPELVMRTLEMVVRPMARYSMPIGIMSWEDVTSLNIIYTKSAKHIVGLSTHTPNWNVTRPRTEQGMGIDPLHLTHMVAVTHMVKKIKNTDNDIRSMWEGIMKSHLTKLAKHHRFPQMPSIRSAYPVLNMMAQMSDVGITWEGQDTQI